MHKINCNRIQSNYENMSEIISIIIEKFLYKFCNFGELDNIKIEITEEEIIDQLTSFKHKIE